MKAGALDRRITIQRPTVVEDPLYGPQPGGWEDVAVRIPARKLDEKPGNTEVVEGRLRLANYPATVRIRYMRGITADMRVILHEETDRVYEITSTPAEIGRREWLEFTIKAYTST